MTDLDALIGRAAVMAELIDNRTGPISGREADNLADLLRELVAALKARRTA